MKKDGWTHNKSVFPFISMYLLHPVAIAVEYSTVVKSYRWEGGEGPMVFDGLLETASSLAKA